MARTNGRDIEADGVDVDSLRENSHSCGHDGHSAWRVIHSCESELDGCHCTPNSQYTFSRMQT
jgi:hypothetical protein